MKNESLHAFHSECGLDSKLFNGVLFLETSPGLFFITYAINCFRLIRITFKQSQKKAFSYLLKYLLSWWKHAN